MRPYKSISYRSFREEDEVMEVSVGKLTSLGNKLGSAKVDLFIGSASFEGRCRSVLQDMDQERIKRALVAVNGAFGTRLDKNYVWFVNGLGDRIERLDVFSHDPVPTLLNIERALSRAFESEPRFVVVDITTLPRESLIILIRVLDKLRTSNSEIKFVYASARQYSFGSQDESNRWLSSGVRDIRPVLGFSGLMRPSRDTHMIVMVGFEDERALELIRACEPTYVSLGVCDPSQLGTQSHRYTSERRLSRLLSVLPDVRKFRFLGYDVVATIHALESQIEIFPDTNAVIVPMSTKISTVGAALLALRDESVQLCYAAPYFYNFDHYSLPGDDYYLFSLPPLRDA